MRHLGLAAADGCEPPLAADGCVPPPATDGCEPSPATDGCEPSPATDGCEPSLATDGCEPSPAVDSGRQWQHDDGRTAAVLHEESALRYACHSYPYVYNIQSKVTTRTFPVVQYHYVFSWLCGSDLARAGAACRCWRRAAADDVLWRRLLRRAAPGVPPAARASCRQQYVAAHAGWRLAGRVPTGGSTVQHAALQPGGARLALLCDDGSVSVWRRAPAPAGWTVRWRARPAEERGWRGVRAQWAERAPRLLLAGTLALVPSWELLVLDLDDEDCGRVRARARCSAGGAGCWAEPGGAAFLSLELHWLAPGRACTTVWLNAASQEAQSEHAGVTAPLLRVYNENGAHITSVFTVSVQPGKEELRFCDRDGGVCSAPAALVATSGQRAGAGCALRAWPLRTLHPPPLRASELGDLRERARRRAAEVMVAPDVDAEPPDEASVRALCTPPTATCPLPAPPVGLVVPPGSRCVWTALGDGGAWCVSLPTLQPLRRLAALTADPLASLHYVQPAVSDIYFVSPARSAGGVSVWTAHGVPACPPPRCPAPVLAALLPPAPAPLSARLLLLAGDDLYVWESRATPQPPAAAE